MNKLNTMREQLSFLSVLKIDQNSHLWEWLVYFLSSTTLLPQHTVCKTIFTIFFSSPQLFHFHFLFVILSCSYLYLVVCCSNAEILFYCIVLYSKMTYPSNLHQIGYHDDAGWLFLPYHPPEVIHCLMHRACKQSTRCTIMIDFVRKVFVSPTRGQSFLPCVAM